MDTTKQVTSAGKIRPPAAGKGRVAGSKNKNTKEIKDMIAGALKDVGGQKYLAEQAIENPVAFMTLLGKILPKDIKAEFTGEISTKISLIKLLPLSEKTE